MDPQYKRYAAGWQSVIRQVQRGRSWSARERNCAFLNPGGPRFADWSSVSGLDFPDDGRGLAMSDWDHDGDLDIWFSNRSGPRLRLMINQLHDRRRKDATPRDFIALRLRGTTCNRDAIGARVEVVLKKQSTADGRPRRLIETLRAGDAYVSQSSKWLHFGLGDHAGIDHVLVRWPGGAVERFTGARAGERYLLVEGTGIVRSWRPVATRRQEAALRPSVQPSAQQTSGTVAVLLPTPIPSPVLRYSPLEADDERIVSTNGRCLLLNLWASWCLPCLGELKEFSARQDELRSGGIDVLALTVDGLDDSKGTGGADARRVLETLDFPFAAGVATPELLDKLDLIQEWLFKAVDELSVPTSFLFDQQGDLAAIYRGPVGVEVLLRDVGLLDAPREKVAEQLVPFPGRWQNHELGVKLSKGVELFHDRYPDEMVRYQKMEIDRWDRRLATGHYLPRVRKLIEMQQARYHYRWAFQSLKDGKFEEAIEHFETTIRLNPEHVKAIGDLGLTFIGVNRFEEAVERLRLAIELDPAFHEVRHNLGVAFERMGRVDEAIAAYRGGLEIEPDLAQTHHRLGRLLASHGDLKEGIDHLQRAVKAQPNLVEAHYDLGHALGAGGQFTSAVSAFRVVVESAPNFAPGYFHLGATLSNLGRLEEAIPFFEKASELAPTWSQPLFALSLMLATYPEAPVYDPARALKLAERAVKLTSQGSPMALASLAAAQAALGDMAGAVATSRKSVEVAKQSGAQGMAEYLRDHLTRYEQGQVLDLTPRE